MKGRKKEIVRIKEETDLVIQIFFLWKYYFIYFLKLIYHYKKEFKIQQSNDNNLELKLQFLYVFIGLVTTNIVIYVLEEYQVLAFDFYYVINEIQFIIAYICITFFFITYALVLNFITLGRKTSIELLKATFVVTLKVFNLIYPFIIVGFSFIMNVAFLEAVNSNLISLEETFKNDNYLVAFFCVLSSSYIYLMGYITFDFIKKYKKINSKIKRLFYFIAILLTTNIIASYIIFPNTFSPAIRYVINKDNLCKEISNVKFKIKQEYNFQQQETDLKNCYKNSDKTWNKTD